MCSVDDQLGSKLTKAVELLNMQAYYRIVLPSLKGSSTKLRNIKCLHLSLLGSSHCVSVSEISVSTHYYY